MSSKALMVSYGIGEHEFWKDVSMHPERIIVTKERGAYYPEQIRQRWKRFFETENRYLNYGNPLKVSIMYNEHNFERAISDFTYRVKSLRSYDGKSEIMVDVTSAPPLATLVSSLIGPKFDVDVFFTVPESKSTEQVFISFDEEERLHLDEERVLKMTGNRGYNSIDYLSGQLTNDLKSPYASSDRQHLEYMIRKMGKKNLIKIYDENSMYFRLTGIGKGIYGGIREAPRPEYTTSNKRYDQFS